MGRKPKHIVEPITDGSFEDVVDAIFGNEGARKHFFEVVEKELKKKKLHESQSSSDDN
ncbi:MAG: hypothetical protein P8P30_03850 [Rickettsiales bacterium]|nr:hypothetical protein [Rickettsiales bacterium]